MRTMRPETQMLKLKSQPRRTPSSLARAYIEIPEEKTVITAKEMALKPRVFSS